jgi:AraC family transcriptional regulator, regulatory protein of adaptative response / methylated-DNA-[protein]-cysteine methyltransferase
MTSEQVICTDIETPIGKMIVGSTEKGCCLLEFHDRGGVEKISLAIEKRYRRDVVAGKCNFNDMTIEQLSGYFAGTLTEFDLPLDIIGTPFEKSVWQELLATKFGKTRSYGEVAAAVGNSQASRAVGRANGANRISIIVPCHRIIEANGNLRGYGGGLWRKRWLLDHEQKVLSGATVSLFE